jgi:hypothetical protein
VKDAGAGTMNRNEVPLTIPRLNPERPSASSLVLADEIEQLPWKSVGTGPFVVGDTKVRPRMDAVFHRDEKMGLYLKLYNLGDVSGQVVYEVRNRAGQTVLEQTDNVSAVPGASASQVTLQKKLGLDLLTPGSYRVKVRIVGKDGKEILSQAADFAVT